jgi:hypothetical protein
MPNFLTFLVVLGAIALVLGICAFTPYTFTAIPACTVAVTSADGKPLENAEVLETAAFYGRREIWKDKKTTDRGGQVAFPARTVRDTLAGRALVKLIYNGSGQPYGPDALLSVCGDGQYAVKDLAHWEPRGTIHMVMERGRCAR